MPSRVFSVPFFQLSTCQADPTMQGKATHTNIGNLCEYSSKTSFTRFCPFLLVKSSFSVMRMVRHPSNSRSPTSPRDEEGEQISRGFREKYGARVVGEPPRRCTGDAAGWRRVSVPGAGAAGLLLFCCVLEDVFDDNFRPPSPAVAGPTPRFDENVPSATDVLSLVMVFWGDGEALHATDEPSRLPPSSSFVNTCAAELFTLFQNAMMLGTSISAWEYNPISRRTEFHLSALSKPLV